MIVHNSRMEPRTQDGLSTSKYRSLFWVSCIPSSRPSVERYVFPLRIRAYDSAPIIIDGSVTNAFLPHIVGPIVLRHMFSSLFWSFSRWRPAPWCKQFSSSLFNIRCHLFDVSICGLGVQLLALVMSRSPSFVASQVHAQKPAMSSAAHMIRLLLLSVSMSTKRMWLQAVVSTPD
jgi:hypothetical protein